MESQHLTVSGVVTPDGFLHVDVRTGLPPGPVNITFDVPSPTAAGEDVRTVLEEIWAARKARGAIARTKEEIDAEINAMRNDDEARMQEIELLQGADRERKKVEQ